MVLGLCDRFHKLPSEVLGEGVGLLRLLNISALGAGPVQRVGGVAVADDDDW